MTRTRRWYFIALAALVVITGCSAGPATPDDRNARNRDFFLDAANEAEAAGASAEQVEVLRGAAHTGTLSGAQVEPLFEPYFTCIHDGFGAVGEIVGTVEVAPGLVIPSYEIRVGPADMTEEDYARWDVVDAACYSEHLEFAWRSVQLQPVAEEAWEQDFARRKTAILACLDKYDQGLPEDATTNEIIDAATLVMEATGERCLEVG